MYLIQKIKKRVFLNVKISDAKYVNYTFKRATHLLQLMVFYGKYVVLLPAIAEIYYIIWFVTSVKQNHILEKPIVYDFELTIILQLVAMETARTNLITMFLIALKR